MSEPAANVRQSLTEHIRDWKTSEMLVDQENRLVKNVALTGRESSNGYRYSEQALKESLPLYENKPVFLDHAASLTQPHQRSTRDLVGSVIHARFEQGRIRGDIRVIDTEAGRTFLALAQSNGPSVGMSHVILAEKNADGTLVEKIHEVVSVDAVVFPATTKSFQEQRLPAVDSPPNNLTTLKTQRDAIQRQITNLKQELVQWETQRELEHLLEESRLPPRAVTNVFRQQLLTAPSTRARQTLIQDRRNLWDSLSETSPSPYSHERLHDDANSFHVLTDEQLIAAIRR